MLTHASWAEDGKLRLNRLRGLGKGQPQGRGWGAAGACQQVHAREQGMREHLFCVQQVGVRGAEQRPPGRGSCEVEMEAVSRVCLEYGACAWAWRAADQEMVLVGVTPTRKGSGPTPFPAL